MASPQWQDGFTKIANEIMESLARIRIPGEARQIIDVIIRKTYGFNKKEDNISLSQFSLATGLKKPNIIRALQKAIKINLIIKKDNDKTIKYRFNKDFDSWKPLSKKITVIQKDNKSLSKKIPTKEISTKDNSGKNPAVKKIIDFFYETVLKDKGFKPQIDGKADGASVKRCLRSMPEQEVKDCIRFYVNSQKADEKGITLKACLSTHSINLCRQNWQKVKGLYE